MAKKLVEISFWGRPVLEYDGDKCAEGLDSITKGEVVATIKKNRTIMKESDF